MKYILPVIVNLFFIKASFSQNIRCATDILVSQREQSDSTYAGRLDETYKQISQAANHSALHRSGEIKRIPVVVHVVYNNDEQNVSDELVLDQIETLNRDYRRKNADTTLTRAIFSPVAGDAGIEFFLAEWDPQGLPTNGITRTQTDVATFINFSFDLTLMKTASTGGADAWPVSKYLNIWVCNMAIPILNVPFILGFATPPDGAPNWPAGSSAEQPQYDGVVVHYEVFGSHPDATGPLATTNRGRTATHEVGHYLGLRHIWGDGQGADVCVVDDGIDDTPKAAAANQQTCDYLANSCQEGSEDLPDMLENYMDYSDENCLNMFTKQQISAMHYVLDNFRQDLLVAGENSPSAETGLRLYPNPASTILTIKNELIQGNAFSFSIYQADGTCVMKGASSDRLDISGLSCGLYSLVINDNARFFSGRFIKD